MTTVEWQSVMSDAVDGIGANLSASATASIRVRLQQFRTDASAARTRAEQKRFEHSFETFVQSKPCLRASAKRHLSPRVIAAVNEANEALKKAEVVLKAYKQRQGSQ